MLLSWLGLLVIGMGSWIDLKMGGSGMRGQGIGSSSSSVFVGDGLCTSMFESGFPVLVVFFFFLLGCESLAL